MNDLIAFSVLLVISTVLERINRGLLVGTHLESSFFAYFRSLKELEVMFIISLYCFLNYWWCEIEVKNITLRVLWYLIACILMLIMLVFALSYWHTLLHSETKYRLLSDEIMSKTIIFFVFIFSGCSALNSAVAILKMISPLI
jgi:hypothetical protein